MPPLSVNIHVLANIMQNELRPFHRELDKRLVASWSENTPVSADQWLEHISYIRELPQARSVHAMIRHATNMQKYFELDLQDSLVLLLGLLPLHWKPELAILGWNPIQGSTHLALVEAEEIWAIWQVLCYICYVIFADGLVTPGDSCEEADLLSHMRMLLLQNPEDEYLTDLVFPFITKS